MLKRIISFLLALAMAIGMLPMICPVAYAFAPELFVTVPEQYVYQHKDNQSSVPCSDFVENDGWAVFETTKTKDFTALFTVINARMNVPAYTAVSFDLAPSVSVITLTEECSSYFGLELFCFDNEGDWNSITFNTDENTTRSNGYSVGRDIDRALLGGLSGDGKAGFTAAPKTITYDNSQNDKAEQRDIYYGILCFYRETEVFEHQLEMRWNFQETYNYIEKYLYYDANGGTGYADPVIASDTKRVTLHNGKGFSKENAAFIGWFDGKVSYAPGGEYSKSEGAKLSAQYLTYDLNGGSGTVTPGVRGEDGLVLSSGEGITKANSAFVGWADDSASYAPGELYTGTQSNQLFAQYLTYDLNGGSGTVIPGVRGEDGLVIADGENITKENCSFVGWSDGTTVYAPGELYTGTENVTLSAQYLTYDLSSCSGFVTPGIQGEEGLTIAGGDSLMKVGHSFVSWNTEPNGNGDPYAPGDVYSGSNNFTLYPIFEPNEYDLTIITDNCTVNVNQNPAVYGTTVQMTGVGGLGYQVGNYEVYKTDDPTVSVSVNADNSFVQPEYPVTVKPNLIKIPYAVIKNPCENGSFIVSSETAVIEDSVTVTATPAEGFELDSISVSRVDNGEFLTVAGDGSFTMVPSDVRISVTFKNIVYDIAKAPSDNGSFTLDPERAILGQAVVVKTQPDEGYQEKTVTAYKTGEETLTVPVTNSSFVMPAFPVTVAVEFELAPMEIVKSNSIENGDITISNTVAIPGTTVTVSAQPAVGYTLDAITVFRTGNASQTVPVTGDSFEMPKYPVTVHATFQKIDYTVSAWEPSTEQGSFTLDKSTAQMGDTVTVNIACAEGWAVRGITITGSNGESRFVDRTFTMPADNVTVSVSYMVVPTYIITIPAAAELGGSPMTVAISDAVMAEGVNLKVDLETDLIARTAEGAEKPFTINWGTVRSGDVILKVPGGGTPQTPKSGSTQLTLNWDDTYQYSGKYRATLAFTIRVEDEGYDKSQ